MTRHAFLIYLYSILPAVGLELALCFLTDLLARRLVVVCAVIESWLSFIVGNIFQSLVRETSSAALPSCVATVAVPAKLSQAMPLTSHDANANAIFWRLTSVRLSVCLVSVRLSVGLSFRPSFRRSVRLSTFPSVVTVRRSVDLSVDLNRRTVRPSVRLAVGPSVRLAIGASVGPSCRRSVCPSVRLSFDPSHLSIRPSVRPSCPRSFRRRFLFTGRWWYSTRAFQYSWRSTRL